ncbi:hypothetical protein BpHYR1_017244 [Brachionus plicatilis]|uniref:Uncharacterized protein n=1 Tax=Brachionus plicatilis TaxID=10195 RepID=A0A3M7SPF7_BRAPC|nr:hypothetical protein BpHYR1_017244 [Brachionus plicatilis]
MSPSSVLDLVYGIVTVVCLKIHNFQKHKGVLHQMCNLELLGSTLVGFLTIIIKLLNDACNTSKMLKILEKINRFGFFNRLIIYQKEQKNINKLRY